MGYPGRRSCVDEPAGALDVDLVRTKRGLGATGAVHDDVHARNCGDQAGAGREVADAGLLAPRTAAEETKRVAMLLQAANDLPPKYAGGSCYEDVHVLSTRP